MRLLWPQMHLFIPLRCRLSVGRNRARMSISMFQVEVRVKISVVFPCAGHDRIRDYVFVHPLRLGLVRISPSFIEKFGIKVCSSHTSVGLVHIPAFCSKHRLDRCTNVRISRQISFSSILAPKSVLLSESSPQCNVS